MKKLLLSGVAVAALFVAAETPAKAVPLYNWTGCYIGGNIGGGWAHKSFDPNLGIDFFGGNASPSSFVGGVQVGCDVQNSMWVFSVQALFDWASMKAGTPFFAGKAMSARIPWFASATGRVGYLVQPTTLIFVRGGAAFVRDEFEHIRFGDVAAKADVTRSGWLLGGGFEWMFAPNWSLTVEYGYMGFGTKSATFEPITLLIPISDNVHQHVQTVLVGMNYRFGTMGRP